jgi:hypothetical protein
MRKLFLVPLAMLNLAVLTGANLAPVLADQSDPISVIPGTWTLNYNFSCTGSTTPVPMIFNANGSFSIPSQSLTGAWAFSGDTIRFTFNGTNATVYTGIEYNNTMKGRSAARNGSFYGCWTATKDGAPLRSAPSNVGADGSGR